MTKHKLLLVGSIAATTLVVLAVAIFAGYKLMQNSTSKTNTNDTDAKVQTPAQIAESQKTIADFNSVIAAYNKKDYAGTISLATAYGTNPNNGSTEKLNLYRLCITAATDSKQDTAKSGCYEAGKQVANSLADDKEKQSWLGWLADAFNGTSSAQKGDDASQ